MFLIRLYVVGSSERAQKAVTDLRAILDSDFKGQYNLEVVDVLKNPELAEEDKILATPTVAKLLPEPVRKVIGDLSAKDKILLGLDLKKIS